MSSHYRQSFLAALTGHLVLVIVALAVSVLPGCRRPAAVQLPFEIDVRNLDTKVLSRPRPPPEHPLPPPPLPPELHTPAMPVDPVAVRPRDPASVKPPERDSAKPAPDGALAREKPKPAASNRVSTAMARPPVEIGERVERIVPGRPATPRVSGPPRRLLPALTPGQLDPLAGMQAPPGEKYGVPLDERQRCFLAIKQALYGVWERPALADAGQQTVMLEIRFDRNGRAVGASIARSSGSEIMDHSVLAAARDAPRVDGLTDAFLREYPKLTIEFEVEK